MQVTDLSASLLQRISYWAVEPEWTTSDFDAEVAAAIDALEDCDVRYETHPMETTLEAESLEAVFTAAQTATEAVDARRVSTTLKIDHYREDSLTVDEKVARVEEHLDGEACSQ